MHTLVYKKAKTRNIRKIIRFFGLGISLSGLIFGMYVFFPLFSWEVYLKPAFANQSFAAPIPKTTIVTQEYIQDLIKNTASSFRTVAYNNSQDWLPASYKDMQVQEQVSLYTLSIPKLNITGATGSTIDNDLSQHLVHFPGTAVPPNKGNAAVFGHSTLPQLYDPKNYKTIFANILNVKVGDTFLVTVNNTLYTYKVIDISIVEADDDSYLTQQYDGSYLTIITCTPPGTTWKRLIIKSKLEKI